MEEEMLDVLMKNGGYRIDYFESEARSLSDAAALYIRADAPNELPYSRLAKHQLYEGLAIIAAGIGFHKLVGIYIDVSTLENVARPAYQRLKQDLLDSLFRRVLVIEPRALLGDPQADADLVDLYWSAGGFELINYESGYPVSMKIANRLPAIPG
ncbi:MAG TPA: hypothetical protein DDW19_05865 [Anaerolineaceae bacterium]|jgi:hypothetical protein|nr:hypothetical protein [Anaerolineaceae bacterium]